mgnify:CR=1 FL=1
MYILGTAIKNDKIEKKSRYVVGVNKFVKEDEEVEIPILEITDKVQTMQIQRIKKIRSASLFISTS